MHWTIKYLINARHRNSHTDLLHIMCNIQFWFDPVIVNAPHAGIDHHALLRLVDENRADFCAPEDLAPGIGLAGALFKELSTLTLLDSVLPHSTKLEQVVWREVVPITEDPDQPFNLRLKLAAQAGIGLAAGVRFHFRGTQGLVVYMARGECLQILCET